MKIKNIKKFPEKKIVVHFDFEGIDEKKHSLPNARLKINENGGTSCLIKDEFNKWKAIKGELKSIKINYETKKK
jgi:hypothetical protein